MSFSSIIGQGLAVDIARRWLAKETTHPLLFYGPEGVGKRKTALEVAKALNCETNPGKEPCDPCASCHKIDTGNHPDVRVLDLAYQATHRNEAIEKQQTIRIETVMEERRRLLQSALEGTWKVMILDEAHRLTPDAANVLLKILEEPPTRTAMVLITPFRDRLLATVRSRCQPVRFRPLADEEIEKVLTQAGVPAEDRSRVIDLASGSPGKALHLNRKEEIESLREAESLWNELAHQGSAAIVQRFESRARGMKVTRGDIENRVHHLLLPAAQALRHGDSRAPAALQALHAALQQLRQNAPPALVYDNLLIQLARSR